MHQVIYTLALVGGLWYLGDKLIKPRLSKYLKYREVKSHYKARAYGDGGVGGWKRPHCDI
jgi:hypothetical protein